MGTVGTNMNTTTTKSAGRRGTKTAGEGDIVIIGAGLAGLFTALRLAPLPVTVIAAAPLGEGASSAWAQGGIAAAVGEGDTPQQHAHDTVVAGAGIVDETVARIVAEEGPERIRDLLKFGVPFDRDLAGHFVLSREAAHSQKRVVRVSGDRAGFAIMQALIATVRATPSIRVLEHYEAEDLILTDGRVTGLRLIRSAERGNGTYDLIPASAVVLATGGIGALYAVTTNPTYARGEAIAFAARAGAVIADAEFVQFHPTAMDLGIDPAPLATEALRGEGATLINAHGDHFMAALHPDADLAPRDIVARGVFAEIAAGRGAYLDARAAIGERFAHEFPTNYAAAMSAGINPEREPIPVAPAAHYHMGGVSTDLNGRTTVPGLWAAGEVASTGLHGANRLASNSLLEATVFGARVADDIRKAMPANRASDQHLSEPKRVGHDGRVADPIVRAAAVKLLRETMSRDVGVIRTAAGLRRALVTFHAIEQQAGGDTVLANMALAARFTAGAALMRKESRGGHFRSDYPDAKPDLARRSFITLVELDRLTASARRQRRARQIEPAATV